MGNNNKFQTIKIWRETLKLLYRIKSYTMEDISVIVDRLARKELEAIAGKTNDLV